MGKPIYDFTRTLHDLPYLSQDMMMEVDGENVCHLLFIFVNANI